MGTYILGGSNTNDDTGVLNAQGDVNALSDLTVSGTADITGDSTLSNASLSGTLSVTGDSTLASTTASSLTVSDTLTSPNINASASPLDLQVAGSTVATLDSSGDLTTDGWVYVKGKNRAYQQNLTASTTTSTTATLLGTAISFTPEFSGYLVISAVVRVSNDTVGDGVNVSLLNGTTSLDNETYTQEGVASNSHTIVLHYELSGQTIGTALSISLNFNAVTGGTASAKIVSFTIAEI
jgi:hypothetical protein